MSQNAESTDAIDEPTDRRAQPGDAGGVDPLAAPDFADAADAAPAVDDQPAADDPRAVDAATAGDAGPKDHGPTVNGPDGDAAAPGHDARRDPKADGTDPLAAELMAMGGFADAADEAPTDGDASAGEVNASELEELLRQARFESADGQVGGSGGGAAFDPRSGAAAFSPGRSNAAAMPATLPLDLPNFQQVMRDAQASSIDLLRDVELNVKIELGRSRMLVEDVLKLGEGAVVELDKLAGDPVDVFVNDRLVARGEVLVLNDNFCVRVNEILAAARDDL